MYHNVDSILITINYAHLDLLYDFWPDECIISK